MLRSKSIAQKFAAFMMLLPVSTGVAFSSADTDRALAQSTQGALGQCILDLRQAYIYGSDAADRCVNQLQSQPATQTLGQCIQDMRLAYVYGQPAADLCQRLLASQQQNTRPRNNQVNTRTRRTLTVNNNYETTLVRLFLSPASQDSWGRDILGSNVLDPGNYMNFTLGSSECAYDIMAEFNDGNVIEDQFDSCRYNTYNLN